MRSRRVISEECARACQWASLRLDSQLSEIEELLLETHLEQCPDCRAFTGNMAVVTETIRATPLEQPAIAFQAPRKRGVRAVGLRALSASAAVAVVGLVSFQLATSRGPNAVASSLNLKLIGLKEEQMDELDASAAVRPKPVLPGLAAAERMTVGSPQVTRRRPAVQGIAQ